jgi:hypothetical protein
MKVYVVMEQREASLIHGVYATWEGAIKAKERRQGEVYIFEMKVRGNIK